MDAATPNSRFAEFNLDPALAETVETAPADQIVEGILRLEDPNEVPPLFSVVSRFNRVCTGRFRAADVWTIRRHPNVISFKAARPLGVSSDGEDPAELASPGETGMPPDPAATFGGRGCIVAALDFGLDFAHPNFLNPDGTTRLVGFWHQGATYDEAHPNQYGYGRVFSREEINAALQSSDPYQALGYHPEISDTGNGSHGAHTLDIAAGNGRAHGARASAASQADLMFIHLSTPRLGAVGDLGDSVRVLEALDYVERTARGRPWVVNLSVGRTAGCHDGTSLVEQGMHELLRLGPGRAIVQSAGNYRSANLGVQGWLRDGEYLDLEWIIDPEDTTGNEIDAWYSGKDRFVIAIRPPQGTAFVEVKLGDVADIVHEGAVVGRIYHRKNDPNNRDNHAEVFLYTGAPPGVWTVRLIGEYVISGRFHVWIERDLARPGAQSRFDAKITSQSYTLGTIATSPLVITVGAYDANAEGTPLAPFSSCGPTRDERRDKPELVAPGVGVVAARSIPRDALRQEGLLIARSGTSMAAPHVTGAVAAMFEAAGRPVFIDEIRDCLKRSAEPLTDCEQVGCCSWGRLNTAEAIRRIRGLEKPELVSAPQGGASVPEPWIMAPAPAVSDAVAEDFASVLEEQEIEAPLDEGALMNSDVGGRFLDRVEHALRSSPGGREESERGFLERLLGELGGDLPSGLSSPADLFRAVLRGRAWMPGERLEALALPSQRPRDSVRAGDWLVRATPGTGDVGHIAVLASGELLSQSMLASEGIAAESAQPGYYGMVIEGGAFPHSRREPFARRFLDSRGRVPPNTVILRPISQESDASGEFTPPAWLKIGQRSRRGSGEAEGEWAQSEEADTAEDKPSASLQDCQKQITPQLLPSPPAGSPHVGRRGLRIALGAEYKIQSANSNAEIHSIVLGSLLRPRYSPQLAAAVACEWDLKADDVKPGTPVPGIVVHDDAKEGTPPVNLIRSLKDRALLNPAFDDGMIRTIEHAWAIDYAWKTPPFELTYTVWRTRNWIDKELFTDFVWQQRTHVEALRALLFPQLTRGDQLLQAVLNLWSSLSPGADLLGVIETKASELRNAPGYKALFSEDPRVRAEARGRFLNVCAGRFSELAKEAHDDAKRGSLTKLRKLLTRFDEDYRAFAHLKQVAQKPGHDFLRAALETANAPPFPSHLRTSLDESRAGNDLSAIPVGATLHCQMIVNFDAVSDAFGAQYYWEVLKIEQGAEGAEKLEKTSYARKWTVLKSKVSRQIDYTAADHERAGHSDFTVTLGGLRVLGSSIKGVLSAAMEDQDEREVVLKETGLFRVRCIVSRPGPEHKGAVLRAPSIAFADCRVVEGMSLSSDTATKAFVSAEDISLGVDALLQQQLNALETALKQPARSEIAFGPKAREQAQKQIENLKARLQRRRAEFTRRAPGVTPFRLVASLVLDDGPTIALAVEAAELPGAGSGTTTVVVVDSTIADGRVDSAPGKSRIEAVIAALKLVLEHGDSKYGRGYCTVIIPIDTGDVEWDRQTFRVNKASKGLLSEFIEGMSLLVSVLAIVAAPFTGGASLALLIPAGLIGIVPSAFRLADRHSQGTLRWNLETALDLVDVLGGFFGIAGKAGAALKLTRLSKGFMIADQSLGVGGVVLGNEQFFRQIEEISKDDKMLPAQKRFAIAMAVSNKLLSDGIAAGAHLARHAQDWISKDKTDPIDLVLSKVKPPPGVAGADLDKLKAGLKVARKTDLQRVGMPDGVTVDLKLVEEARALTGKELIVVRDGPPRLVGKDAEVRYSLDRFGFISDVYVALGPNATSNQLKSHARTAARIAGYMGVVGRLRTLFLRALALITNNATLDVGRTVAWEASLELKKLNEQLNDHLYSITKQDADETPSSTDAYLRGLLEQIDEHEVRLHSAEKGTGVIAAQDRPRRLIQLQLDALTTEARKLLLKNGKGNVVVSFAPDTQKHIGVRKVKRGQYEISVPKTLNGVDTNVADLKNTIARHLELSLKKPSTAEEEAEYRGYPTAEPGYKWVVPKGPPGTPLQYEGDPPRQYSAARGTFIDVLKLLDVNDRLTNEGVQWLRDNVPALANIPDDNTIRGMFNKTGVYLEKVFFAEYSDDLRKSRTDTYLVYFPEERGGKQTVPTLNSVVRDVLRRMNASDKQIANAMKILESRAADIIAGNKSLREKGQAFLAGADEKARDDYMKLVAGQVKMKRPDLFEFDLTNREGTVTDVTHAFNSEFHNFKTEFYQRVFELAIPDAVIKSLDWRSVREGAPVKEGQLSRRRARSRPQGTSQTRMRQKGAISEGESLMNSKTVDDLPDRVELALRSSNGKGRESETSFLQQLLRELGVPVFASDLTPAGLFRAAVNDMSLMQSAKGLLTAVALPSTRPQDALRAGDWVVRATPGTGDVGHIAVLASGDLLTPSMLASEGIAAESAQPGYYGIVIEGGAFPHDSARPFARRLLDSRGRVPPHAMILRPKYPDTGMADFPQDEQETNGAESAVGDEELEDFVERPIVEEIVVGGQFEPAQASAPPTPAGPDSGLGEAPLEQAPQARFRTVFYDLESMRYLDGWTRAKGPSAVILIERSIYDTIRADGARRGRAYDQFLAQSLTAAGRGRVDWMPPVFHLDPTLATVPLNRQSRGDWDDLMIAQLLDAGRRLTIQSERDQWTLINRIFDNAKADARDAARSNRAAREFAAYFALDHTKATLALVEATNITMKNGHAEIPVDRVRSGKHEWRSVPGNATIRVIGDIHTHYLLDPLIALNRASSGMTIRSSQTSLHSGVSEIDVNSARSDHIVVYAIDSKYLHRANPNGTKNDELPRSGDVLREALRVFGGEPGPNSSD
jgi:subtilisin family serine protease